MGQEPRKKKKKGSRIEEFLNFFSTTADRITIKADEYKSLQQEVLELRKARREFQERESKLQKGFPPPFSSFLIVSPTSAPTELKTLKDVPGKPAEPTKGAAAAQKVASFFGAGAKKEEKEKIVALELETEHLKKKLELSQQEAKALHEKFEAEKKKLMASAAAEKPKEPTTPSPPPPPPKTSVDLLLEMPPGHSGTGVVSLQATSVVPQALALNEKMAAEVAAMRAKVADAAESNRLRIESLEKELAEAKSRPTVTAVRRDEAESKELAELRAAKTSWAVREEESREQVIVAKTEAEKARRQAAAADAKIATMQADIDRLKERIAEGERRERTAAGEEVQAIMQAKQRATEELDTASRTIGELKATAKADRERLEKELASAMETAREMRASRDEHASKLKEASERSAMLDSVGGELAREKEEHAKQRLRAESAEARERERGNELATARKEAVRAAERAGAAEKDLEHERSLSMTYKKQVDQVSASVSKVGTDFDEAMRLVAEKTARVAGLEGRCSELEKLLDQERTAHSASAAAAEASKAKSDEIEARAKAAEAKNEENTHKIAAAAEMLNRAKVEIDSLRKKAEEDKAAAESAARAKDSEIAATAQEKARAEARVEELKASLDEAEKATEAARAQVTSISGQLDKALVDLVDVKRLNLEMTSKNSDLEADVARTAAALKQAAEARDSAEGKATQLGETLAAKTKRLAQVEEELQRSTEEVTEAQVEVKNLRETKRKLETDLDAAGARADAAEASAAELKKKSEEEIAAMKERIQSLEREAESLRAQLAQTKSTLEGKQADLVKTTAEREELRETSQSLGSELKETKGKLEGTEKEKAETEKALKETTEKLEASEKRATGLETDLGGSKTKVAELSTEVARMTEQAAEAKTEITGLKEKVAATEKELSEVKEAEKKVKEERDGLTATAAEQRKKLAEVQEHADELGAQLADHSLLAAEVQMKKDKQIIRELKGELTRYRDFFAATGANPDAAKDAAHRRTPSGKLPPMPPNMTPEEMRQRLAQVSRERFELETRCKQLEAEATHAREELESWKSDAVQGYVGMHKTHLNAAAPAAGASTPQRASAQSPAPQTSGKKALTSFVSMFKPGSGTASPGAKQIPEEFATRVQSVLEETLLRNVQLQNDMAMLGSEFDGLLKHTRTLERKLREAGLEVPERPKPEPPQQQSPRTSQEAQTAAAAPHTPGRKSGSDKDETVPHKPLDLSGTAATSTTTTATGEPR